MAHTLDETADFAALKGRFTGDIIVPGSNDYETARKTFSVTHAEPAGIVRPLTNEDIAAAIQFATTNGLQLSVRSGKHSAAGFSTNTGGLVLDLAHFNTIEILDETAGIVRLGSGALWGDVAVKLAEHGLVMSSGDTKSVGVGGLTLGGGIGWMVRKYGFTIDSLVAVEIVLADGSMVRANATENSDLFWAVRGGGGNFGVVTSFDFQAHPGNQVVASTITYGTDNLANIITGWRDHMRTTPEELTSFLTLLPSFGPAPAMVMIMSCYAGDDETAAQTAIAPLRTLAVPTKDSSVLQPYTDMLQEAHPPQGLQFIAKDMFVKTLDGDVVTALGDICCKPGSPIVQLRAMGGAVDAVAAQATALAHRGNEMFLFAGFPTVLDATPEQITDSLKSWEKLAAYSSGAYSNFMSTNTAEDVAAIYPETTYARLADIKRQYDPQNIFSHNFNITPAEA